METEFRLIVVALALASATLVAQEPSFRPASSELVVLPVTVTDGRGRFITDLPSQRFAVYDNDRRQSIAIFTNEDTPVTVGLVVDSSTSMRVKLGEVVTATTAFARLSNPQDELFALAFNDDVHDVLQDRPFLLAGDTADFQAAVSSLKPQGRTALYDALVAALDHLELGSQPRKVLVLISDGGDNGSRATREAVLARARRSTAAIYAIGLIDADDPDSNPGVLKSVARATGGERYLPKSAGELLQICEHIAHEIRSGYTIAYEPPDRDGRYHELRVKVDAGRRVSVRTRPGYFAAAGAKR